LTIFADGAHVKQRSMFAVVDCAERFCSPAMMQIAKNPIFLCIAGLPGIVESFDTSGARAHPRRVWLSSFFECSDATPPPLNTSL